MIRLRLTSDRTWLQTPAFIPLAAAALLCACPWCAPAAEGKMGIRFAEPGLAFFEARPDAAPLLPEEGHLLAGGRFSSGRFEIDDISQLAVQTADGPLLPLLIEQESVVREFDRIISVKLFFNVSPAQAVVGRETGFVLVWGPDIRSENKLFSGMAPDRNRRHSYLEIEWVPPAQSAEEMSAMTIEVVADSHAEYYALWYLLPMALLFALLTVRKLALRSRHENRP